MSTTLWQPSEKYSTRKEDPRPIHVLWAVAGTLTILGAIACLALSIASGHNTDAWYLSNLHEFWATNASGLRGANIPLTGLLASLFAALVAITVTLLLSYFTRRAPTGVAAEDEVTAATSRAALHITSVVWQGVNQYLKAVFAFLFVFGALWAIAIAIGVDLRNESWRQMIAFVVGASVVIITNLLGAQTTTAASARALLALRTEGISGAIRVGFSAGATVGIFGISFGTLILGGFLLILRDQTYLAGVALGASTVALVNRVWGGLIAKGADLVYEKHGDKSSELAVLVGSQINDAVAAASDAIESFITIVAAAVILATFPFGTTGADTVFWLAGSAIVSNLIAVLTLRGGRGLDSEGEPVQHIRADDAAANGNIPRVAILVATIFNIGLSALVIFFNHLGWRAYVSYVIGVVLAFVVAVYSDSITNFNSGNTKALSETSETTSARLLVHGLFQGLFSTVFPVIVLFLTIIVPLALGENYKNHARRGNPEFHCALAALGFTSIAGVMAAIVSFGAVATTTRGIAANVDASTSKIVSEAAVVEDLGRSSHNLFRGWAAASALLVAHIVVRAFVQAVLINRYEFPRGIFYLTFPETQNVLGTITVGADHTSRPAGSEVFFGIDPLLLPEYALNLLDKRTVSGLLVGAVTPLLIAGLVLDGSTHVAAVAHHDDEAVTGTATAVRRLATRSFVRSIVPLLFPVVLTMLIGFDGGPYMQTSWLLASIITGFLLSTVLANAGSTFDSARRYIESGSHEPKDVPSAQSVESVTPVAIVGQAWKDGASGTVNVVIKYIALLSLVYAPAFYQACKDSPIWESYCYSTRPAPYLPKATAPPQ